MKFKQVLVTGSSGFLGSHVADALEEEGSKVVLFDSTPSIYKTDGQNEVVGDILNKNDIEQAIKGCDAVFHFAAQADIDSSSSDPTKTIQTNIMGTQNLLEVSRINKIKRFIFASTIYVYSDLGSFYRVSKQSCEKIIEEYQIEYSLDYTILRFGSLYGPRSNEFNGIRNYLLQALRTKKIIRRGDGEEIREYIHAKDAARLSVNAMNTKFKNKHLIVTGHQQIRVKDLLGMIKEILGGNIEIEFGKEEELHHYKITPYSYKPQVAIKVTPEIYYDLGQGLTDQIYDLQSIMEINNDNNKISLRKRKK